MKTKSNMPQQTIRTTKVIETISFYYYRRLVMHFVWKRNERPARRCKYKGTLDETEKGHSF